AHSFSPNPSFSKDQQYNIPNVTITAGSNVHKLHLRSKRQFHSCQMTSSAIRAATIDSKRQWRVASTIPIAIGWIGMRIKHVPLSWEEFFIFKFEMVARMMRRDIAMLLESIFVCHFSYSDVPCVHPEIELLSPFALGNQLSASSLSRIRVDIYQAKSICQDLIIVHSGSEAYRKANQAKDYFLEFMSHQQRLYKKLASEERLFLQMLRLQPRLVSYLC
ncbi:hypothetical protein H5410_012949, partial [Solanum commersonii]